MASKENSFTGIDIHDHEKVLSTYLKRIESSAILCSANKQTIMDYYRNMVSMGLSRPTLIKQLQVMNSLGERIKEKNFAELTKQDIEEIVFWVRKEKVSPWTISKYLISIKRFYKWLKGNNEEYPPEVKWFQTGVKGNQLKLPENLLTQEEVKKLINACQNPRDKCLLSVLNELGCRVGELLAINIMHIEDCSDYYRIILQHSKTQPRKLKVIDSKPFIAEWLNVHSKLRGAESPLFIGIGTKNKNQRLDYDACRILLRKISKRAGVMKAVNPHNWRHSTATRYAKFMAYSQLCYWFGWSLGSRTPSIYIHLSGQDLDSAVDEIRGIKTVKKVEDTLAQKTCRQCNSSNKGTNDLCENCGAAITISGIIQKENTLETLKQEMNARQKVVEEYIKFQNGKIKLLEEKIIQTKK